MKVSCNIQFVKNLVGEKRAIRLIADAGFDAMDMIFSDPELGPYGPWLGDDYAHRARELLALVKDHDLTFNQAHAPLTPQTLGKGGPDVLANVPFDYFERFFQVYSLLEIPHVVVHNLANPVFLQDPELKFRVNLEYYRRLKALAEPYGVRIALENLYLHLSGPESFCRMLDALDDDYFLACVDVGHSNMVNADITPLIRGAGRRVQALHVHDNHVEYDEHLIPGMGSVDWNPVLQALADVDYSGDFTLEVGGHACGCLEPGHGFGVDFLPQVLKFTQRSARYLAHRLEALKQAKNP